MQTIARAVTNGTTAKVSGRNSRSDPETSGPFHETPSGWLSLGAVWLASAGYLAAHLRQGWVPYDAGMLAQEALRTLHGQVPYRNFIEVYTGGLTYLNALAFRLFGTNFFSLRIPLFLFFLGWVPSVYFIARRFVGPVAAGAVTLLSVAWSVPNYPDAMPSWYNLFFATWGILALVRYTETEKQRWLWIAGLCGGLSFLVKIVGLYFIAAALLFFVFRELSLSRQSPGEPRLGALSYRSFASAGLLSFLALVIELILQWPTVANIFYFVLPSTCLVLLLIGEQWRTPATGSPKRFRRLFSMALPFLGGALAPLAIFLAYYIRAGVFGAWSRGVLGASIRLQWDSLAMPSLILALTLAPLLFVLFLACHADGAVRRWAGPAAVVVFATSLALARWSLPAYWLMSVSLPSLVPLLAIGLVVWLYRGKSLGERQRQWCFLLVAVAVSCALIQFPFGGPLYFCYVAPLVILGIVSLVTAVGKPGRVATTAVVIFYVTFAVWLHTPGFYVPMGVRPRRHYSLSRLNLPRGGGLRVNTNEAMEYRRLVQLVQAHAHSPYIYCTADCPQVYFLSGLRNPTRTMYDFLDPDFLDPAVRQDRLLSVLRDHNVNLVVLAPPNRWASGPVRAGLRAALDARFPESAMAGKFEVRWK